MIKLLPLLESSILDPLFHSTSFSSCKKIITSGVLKSNTADQFFDYDKKRIDPKYKNVVFFTTEKDRFINDEPSEECVLVVNKEKLNKDYNLKFYKDPYEEVVLYTNDPSIPILPYLIKVIIQNTLKPIITKKFQEFLTNNNIPFEVSESLKDKVKSEKLALPKLKSTFIKKLKENFPKGLLLFYDKKFYPYQTKEYFQKELIYSYPQVSIQKPTPLAQKQDFLISFFLKPEEYDKYINWFSYSSKDLENLINKEDYNGQNLQLKGDVKIHQILPKN